MTRFTCLAAGHATPLVTLSGHAATTRATPLHAATSQPWYAMMITTPPQAITTRQMSIPLKVGAVIFQIRRRPLMALSNITLRHDAGAVTLLLIAGYMPLLRLIEAALAATCYATSFIRLRPWPATYTRIRDTYAEITSFRHTLRRDYIHTAITPRQMPYATWLFQHYASERDI